MEYISLQERILTECKDQAKEYLVKKGTCGLIGFFSVLSSDDAEKMVDFLKTGNKSNSLDLLLCVIPLVLKNGKNFETNKVISALKHVCPDISEHALIDGLILFSFIFDLFYGANINDALDNINSLNEDCKKKFNIISFHKLNLSSISSIKTDFKSIIVVKDFVESEELSNKQNFNYTDSVSKAIILFIRDSSRESNNNLEVEKKYGDAIKSFLLSI